MSALSSLDAVEMSGWDNPTKPFPFPWGGVECELPDYRLGRYGTKDQGLPLGRVRSHYGFDTFQPNADRGGAREHAFVDSWRQPICRLSTADGIYRLLGLDGAVHYECKAKRGELLLEASGHGAMADAADDPNYLIVLFKAPDRDYGFRAFVHRGAISGDWHTEVGRFSTGRGGTPLPVLSEHSFADPGFTDEGFWYTNCSQCHGLRGDYNPKLSAVLPAGTRIKYLSYSTNAVKGGGVVRSVFRETDVVTVHDETAYPDPNGCRKPRQKGHLSCRWRYVRVKNTNVYGWLPHKVDGGAPDEEEHPFPGTLRPGSRGEAVRGLQKRLAERGATGLKADGDFGPGTEAAVRAFQAERKLEVDGKVGPQTWRTLWE